MARHKLTEAERARGYQKLLRSTSKRAAGLKAYARKWLQEHGYSAAIVLLTLCLLAAPAMAQRANVKYVDQFYNGGANPTVAQMATAAQNACNPDTAVPCYVIFDGILAVYPQGSLPTPCAQCIWVSYMTIGAVQVANNTSPAFATVWPVSVSFPLRAPGSNACTTVNYSNATDTTTGFNMTTQNIWYCIGGTRKWFMDGTTLRAAIGGVFGWQSNADAGLGSTDTGLSRGAADQVNCGNGTAADRSCAFFAGTANFTGAITVASCTGCASGATLVASGTSTMATGALTTGTCATAVTTVATGALTTDAIEWAFASAPVAAQDGHLSVLAYVTSGNVNFLECNNWSTSVTPTALVINWRVIR